MGKVKLISLEINLTRLKLNVNNEVSNTPSF